MRTLILAAVALVAPAVAQPPAPAPRLWNDRVAEALRYERDTVVEGYKRHGSRDPRWDAEAVEFLDLCCEWAARGTTPDFTAEAQARAKRLVDAGCTDPMVLGWAALALDAMTVENLPSRRTDALVPGLLERATTGLEKSKYPKLRQAAVAGRLAARLAEQKRPADRASQRSADLLLAALTDPAEPKAPPAYALSRARARVETDLTTAIAEGLCRRLETSNADAYMIQVLRGDIHTAQLRGVRRPPTAGDRRDEYDRVRLKAREHYEAAYALDPTRPEAPTAMIAIARENLAKKGETPRLWFERATAAVADYPEAYRQMRRSIHAGRGAGNEDKLLDFGLACVKEARFDTMIPMQIVEALRDYEASTDDIGPALARPGVYAAAREAVQRCPADSPRVAAWNQTTLAVIAWHAGEYGEAAAALKAAGERANPSAPFLKRVSLAEVQRDALLFTSPAGEKLADAARAIEARDFERAHSLATEALTLCEGAPSSLQRAARERRLETGFLRAFWAGEWAEAPFDERSVLWKPLVGEWSRRDDATIRARVKRRAFQLQLRPPIGRRWQLRATIDFAGLPADSTTVVGIGAQAEQAHGTMARSRPFALNPAGDWGIGIWQPIRRRHVDLRPGRNELEITSFDDDALIMLNGAEVFRGRLPDAGEEFRHGDYLVIGGDGERQPKGHVEFSGIRLRALKERPAGLPASTPPEQNGRR